MGIAGFPDLLGCFLCSRSRCYETTKELELQKEEEAPDRPFPLSKTGPAAVNGASVELPHCFKQSAYIADVLTAAPAESGLSGPAARQQLVVLNAAKFSATDVSKLRRLSATVAGSEQGAALQLQRLCDLLRTKLSVPFVCVDVWGADRPSGCTLAASGRVEEHMSLALPHPLSHQEGQIARAGELQILLPPVAAAAASSYLRQPAGASVRALAAAAATAAPSSAAGTSNSCCTSPASHAAGFGTGYCHVGTSDGGGTQRSSCPQSHPGHPSPTCERLWATPHQLQDGGSTTPSKRQRPPPSPVPYSDRWSTPASCQSLGGAGGATEPRLGTALARLGLAAGAFSDRCSGGGGGGQGLGSSDRPSNTTTASPLASGCFVPHPAGTTTGAVPRGAAAPAPSAAVAATPVAAVEEPHYRRAVVLERLPPHVQRLVELYDSESALRSVWALPLTAGSSAGRPAEAAAAAEMLLFSGGVESEAPEAGEERLGGDERTVGMLYLLSEDEALFRLPRDTVDQFRRWLSDAVVEGRLQVLADLVAFLGSVAEGNAAAEADAAAAAEVAGEAAAQANAAHMVVESLAAGLVDMSETEVLLHGVEASTSAAAVEEMAVAWRQHRDGAAVVADQLREPKALLEMLAAHLSYFFSHRTQGMAEVLAYPAFVIDGDEVDLPAHPSSHTTPQQVLDSQNAPAGLNAPSPFRAGQSGQGRQTVVVMLPAAAKRQVGCAARAAAEAVEASATLAMSAEATTPVIAAAERKAPVIECTRMTNEAEEDGGSSSTPPQGKLTSLRSPLGAAGGAVSVDSLTAGENHASTAAVGAVTGAATARPVPAASLESLPGGPMSVSALCLSETLADWEGAEGLEGMRIALQPFALPAPLTLLQAARAAAAAGSRGRGLQRLSVSARAATPRLDDGRAAGLRRGESEFLPLAEESVCGLRGEVVEGAGGGISGGGGICQYGVGGPHVTLPLSPSSTGSLRQLWAGGRGVSGGGGGGGVSGRGVSGGGGGGGGVSGRGISGGGGSSTAAAAVTAYPDVRLLPGWPGDVIIGVLPGSVAAAGWAGATATAAADDASPLVMAFYLSISESLRPELTRELRATLDSLLLLLGGLLGTVLGSAFMRPRLEALLRKAKVVAPAPALPAARSSAPQIQRPSTTLAAASRQL